MEPLLVWILYVLFVGIIFMGKKQDKYVGWDHTSPEDEETDG